MIIRVLLRKMFPLVCLLPMLAVSACVDKGEFDESSVSPATGAANESNVEPVIGEEQALNDSNLWLADDDKNSHPLQADDPASPSRPGDDDKTPNPQVPNLPDVPGQSDGPSQEDQFKLPIDANVDEKPDEPIQVANPQEPEEPTGVDTPTVSEEPTRVDTPTVPEEPTGVDTPAVPEEPTGVDTPAVPEEPTGVDTPAVPEEPTDVSTPTEPETPAQPDRDINDVKLPVMCDAQIDDMRLRLLQLVNQARASAQQCGGITEAAAPPLGWNDLLQQAAQKHSLDMATSNFFSHTGSDGLGVGFRADEESYNWRAVGENIAAGYSNAEDTVQGWLQSAGHCRNLMDQRFTEFAVACVRDSGSNYGTYWTQVFASD